MKIDNFSGKVLRTWVEIYHTDLSEKEREVRIRNLPTKLFNEFGALYRSVLDHEVTEAQIKDKPLGIAQNN